MLHICVAVAGNDDVHLGVCDISSLNSVRSFVAEHERSGQQLHVLINNAGILVGADSFVLRHGVHYVVHAAGFLLHLIRSCRCDEYELALELQSSKGKSISADGLELSFATNTLGAFHLTRLLQPVLKRSAPSKVIFMSSGGMYTGAALNVAANDLQLRTGSECHNAHQAHASNIQPFRSQTFQYTLTPYSPDNVRREAGARRHADGAQQVRRHQAVCKGQEADGGIFRGFRSAVAGATLAHAASTVPSVLPVEQRAFGHQGRIAPHAKRDQVVCDSAEC